MKKTFILTLLTILGSLCNGKPVNKKKLKDKSNRGKSLSEPAIIDRRKILRARKPFEL